MRKKILISGSTGQLGSELKVVAESFPQYDFIFKSRQTLDFTSDESIMSNFNNQSFDYFINAAAYTKVDKAEEEVELCYKINCDALTQICNYLNPDCTVIHISSDYVYNHNPGRPLEETDATLAQGIYADSKLQSEKIVLSANENNIVIRTSWVYSSFGHNFMKTMIRLSKTIEKLNIVNDQVGCPTYANDIANAILHIVNSLENSNKQNKNTQLGGVYNYANSGQITWLDFARKIFELKNIDCKTLPISTEMYNAPAHRPKWSVLSMDKIEDTFGIKPIYWEDSLKRCLEVT